MTAAELPPDREEIWPPVPKGQDRWFPSPKIGTRICLLSVFKYGIGFGVGFFLCAFAIAFCMGFTYSAYPPDRNPSMIVVALVGSAGGVAATALLCLWFRFYYKQFGLWMLRGAYAAGVTSLLLLAVAVAFPDLFSRVFMSSPFHSHMV